MAIEQITDPAAFDPGWWLDWCDDPRQIAHPGRGGQVQTGNPANMAALRQFPLASGTQVNGLPPFYDMDVTTVTINQGGAVAEVHYCSNNDFNCNFNRGDCVLAAADPDAAGDPDSAPIRLTFSRPLRAVGSYVSGLRAGDPAATYSATLWVKLAGRKSYEPPVSIGGGRLGTVLPPGRAPTAPFVAARTAEARGIVEACFDVALFANHRFDQVAIAELYGLV